MTNQDRIEMAREVMDSLPSGDLEEDIIDLITNLLHLANSYELDTSGILRMAAGNFEGETEN